ncbi:MAG TPA: hypothetical protein P5228_05265, partial [Bacteroidales bacterium]|nr:hypothetical protein [Bacteroidales bacterium]
MARQEVKQTNGECRKFFSEMLLIIFCGFCEIFFSQKCADIPLISAERYSADFSVVSADFSVKFFSRRIALKFR